MRIALALPLEVEDRLVAPAERHGHTLVARSSTAHELAVRIDGLARDAVGGVDVAIVAATERHLTDRLLAVCDEAGVRLIALTSSEGERRHAASLGLRETADASSDWTALELVLMAQPIFGGGTGEAGGPGATDTAPPERPRGVIVAVWGPAGAPGRTTLAINVAAELAVAGRTVVLADVDTYSGSVAPALGLLDEAPGFAAACRLAGADNLSLGELDRIGQHYRVGDAGFRVLTGIGRPSRWSELSAARVESTLALCRDWADFIVVDTGFSLESDEELVSDFAASGRNGAGIAALQSADHVIAVGAADPVGLSRFLRAHVDLVEIVVPARVIVVMNKIRASAIGLNPVGQVAKTLARFGGIEVEAMVPFDPQALDAAILAGQPLAGVAPRSPARAAIRDLAVARLLASAPQGGRRTRRRAGRA